MIDEESWRRKKVDGGRKVIDKENWLMKRAHLWYDSWWQDEDQPNKVDFESENRQMDNTSCKYAITTENTRPVRYVLPSINNLTLSTL